MSGRSDDLATALYVCMSNQGDSTPSGAGGRSDWKTSNAQIIWVHVVPAYLGAEMTMSPSRCSSAAHRALLVSNPR